MKVHAGVVMLLMGVVMLLILCGTAVGQDLPFSSTEDSPMSRDESLAQRLKKMRQLRSLNIGEEDFDETLRLVAQCPQMQRLDFWGVFDGEALRHLRGHAGITDLDLGVFGIKDETLKVLPTLPNLTKLHLASRDSFHDEALTYVRQCPNLEVLDLFSEHYTAKGYRELLNIESLRRLDIRNVKIPFPSFVDSKLPRLQKLVLSGSGVDDNLAASLDRLPALSDLSLAHASLTDNGFSHLLRLKKLVHLGVDDTRISSESLQRLDEFPELESVFSRGVNVDEPAVKTLCRMSSLKALYVFNSGATAAQKAHIKAALPNCDVEID